MPEYMLMTPPSGLSRAGSSPRGRAKVPFQRWGNMGAAEDEAEEDEQEDDEKSGEESAGREAS